MNNADKQYKELIEYVLENGRTKGDRTGTGTISVFDYTMRFDLDEGFPLITTKKVHWPSVVHELIWFLKGDTNIKYLCENGVSIWNDWPYKKFKNRSAYDKSLWEAPDVINMKTFAERIVKDKAFAKEWGDCGPIYGKQWREWKSPGTMVSNPWRKIDQIANVIDQIKNNPDSRRIIVSAWNVGKIQDMALPPCHAFFQFYTYEMTLDERWQVLINRAPTLFKSLPAMDTDTEKLKKYFLKKFHIPTRALSLKLTQRSCDVGLGVPFNVASYALLLQMVAQVTETHPNEFVWNGSDVHIYTNHVDQLKEQCTRKGHDLPKVRLNYDVMDIDDFTYDHVDLLKYESDPNKFIAGPMKVSV